MFEPRDKRGQPLTVAEAGGGALSVALIGLLVALLAVLLLPWPTASLDDAPLTTGKHYERLSAQAGEGGSPAGLIVDVALYVALVIGGGAYVVARLRGGYAPLAVLVSVGLVGLAYTGSMVVPFVGPLVGLFGFALVLFGAMVAWAAYEPPEKRPATPDALELSAPVPAVPDKAEDDAGNRDTGINDDVSYSPA
jgi:hypothetical protein